MTTDLNGPRLRSLLRQADRVAENGKRAAAVQLYKDIIEEAPATEAAWIGLANVEFDLTAKEKALQKALAINPDSIAAKKGLAKLWGEEMSETETEVVVETAVSSPTPPKNEHQHTVVAAVKEVDEFDLVCYRHPDRDTALRCYNCNKPICSQCAVKTPVGYSCPDCIREKEDIFFNSKTTDYVIAALISLPLNLIVAILVAFIALRIGFFGFFLAFMGGGAAGRIIGRLIKRAVGNRRGRYLPHVVSATLILAAIVVGVFLFAFGGIYGAIILGIYAFVATGAAFYEMK